MKWLLLTLILSLSIVGFSNDTTIAQTDCTFTQTNDFTVELWASPIGGSSGVMMEPNIPYRVLRAASLRYSLTAYEFQTEAGFTGWYERGLNGEFSDDCELPPVEQVDIAEFPDVCSAIVTETTLIFDWDLTQITSIMGDSGFISYTEGQTFLTINTNAISAVVGGSHAMYLGTVATHNLEFDPDCPEHIFITTITAQTLDGARLWSNPHVELGTVTADLPVNTTVEIMAGPVTSIISEDGETEDEWYLVRNDAYGTGWIWAERLQLNSEFPPQEIGIARVTADTRVWSEPDINNGAYLGDIQENTRVHLLGGPIDGAIRTDTDDIGQWYLVQTFNRTITAWVWAGRLDIQPEED